MLTLGPFALPLAPMALIASLWMALWIGGRVAGKPLAQALDGAVLRSALVGLVAARLGHVLAHWPAYAPQPWWMLDIRDGGWSTVAGWLCGCMALAWAAWRAARGCAVQGDSAALLRLRRAIAVAGLTGVALWLIAREGIAALKPPPVPAPAQALLVALDDPTLTHSVQSWPPKGQPVVVNLWATWCGPCVAELPGFLAVQRQNPGVRFAYVNQGEDRTTVQRFARGFANQQGQAWQGVWLDEARAVQQASGSGLLPTTLFYGADGRLAYSHTGLLNQAALQARLDELSREK